MIPPTSSHGETVVFGIWRDLMAFLQSPERETITTTFSQVDRVGEDSKDIPFHLKLIKLQIWGTYYNYALCDTSWFLF